MDMKKNNHSAHQNANALPRGIEVLVKKASVDMNFRRLLLKKRAEAAREIDLELDETEKAMLTAIPREQLEKIIDNTKVPPEQKKVFLSSVGRIMLASVIAGTVVVGLFMPSLGHTLTPEQKEQIMQRQKDREKQTQEMNEPNKTDLKAEADSNE
jgi:hypothetical protein